MYITIEAVEIVQTLAHIGCVFARRRQGLHYTVCVCVCVCLCVCVCVCVCDRLFIALCVS